MKLYRFLWLLPLVVFLAGCSPVDSLNPLYTGKDVVFDPALLGQWNDENAGLNFAPLGHNGYRIVMSGKDDETGQIITVAFDAHLVELEGHRFLDTVWRVSPAGRDEATGSSVPLTRTENGLQIEPSLVHTALGSYLELLPGESNGDGDHVSIRQRQAHQFYKVVMEDNGQTLKLTQLDDGWVQHQIRLGNLMIDHEIDDGGSTVLTADTPALQRPVLDHVNDEEAFVGETTVHRAAANIAQ